MANLGTLWFGADIDLTQLKQKISQGNRDILDALKLSYDPQSYQQMVNRLRTELSKETFEVKLSANTQLINQQLQKTISTINSGLNAPTINPSGLKGINAMTSAILDQKTAILDNRKEVQYYKEAWGRAINQFGRRSTQAMDAFNVYDKARADLRKANWELQEMNIARGRATLSQKALNEQMRESSRLARQWNTDHMRLNATLAGGIHVSTQLGSALSGLFALDAARQFLGYVIEIGGQLEKQRISIAAILGDTVKATHLFEQIKGLALQSPFGVVELDQFTKQLSAYGFKYNELFDMTKRLADISAGAGTDIGRLTLALGHVRSATYLTGITLRQFSMNNIPMLKMLADYYTEIEKKAVSTADVQKRISKRQVSYEDVIEQIRRLTDEGGMFYNMQEKISESVAAKFKNLKDAMDIMYGEMAEGTVGNALKSIASALLKTTRHWKEIISVMMAAGAAFLYTKMRIGYATLTMQGNTAATIKQILADKQLAASQLRVAGMTRTLTDAEKTQIATAKTLTASDIQMAMATNQLTKDEVLNAVALKQLSAAETQALITTGLFTKAEIQAAQATKTWELRLNTLSGKMKTAFLGVGKGAWTALALMAATELYMAWDSWNSRIDEKAEEMKDLIKSRIIDLKKMQKTMLSDGVPKDSVALKHRIDEMKQVLANSEEYTKTLDEQLSKTEELPKQYEILAGAINDAVEENKKMLDVQERAKELIKETKWGSPESYNKNSPSGFVPDVFNDDIKSNVEDIENAYKKLRKTLDTLFEYKEPLQEFVETIKNSNIGEDLKAQLEQAPFEEQLRILAENGYWKDIEDKIKLIGAGFKNSEEEISKVCKKLRESFNGVSKEWEEVAGDDIPKIFNKLLADFDGDEKKLKQWVFANIDDVRYLLDGILDQIDEKEPQIRNSFKRMFLNYVRFADLMKTETGRALAEGAMIGASAFDSTTMDRLLKTKELTTIKDINDTTDKDKGKDKKDKELEAAKTSLQQYKTFLSEYKKYREMYDKERAINILEKLFPEFKGQGANIIDNYASVIDALINKLVPSYEKASEARKKFYDEGKKTIADTLFDREKELVKKNADAMSEYIKRMEEQWKLYRTLMKKSGGNRDFAAMAFNTNGMIWDETAKEMLSRFNQRGNELGVRPLHFDWDFNEEQLKEALVNTDGVVQDELVKLAQEIQKVIRGNYKQFLEDSAEAYNKSLTAAEKLVELERQRQEIIDRRKADNDQSPERQRLYYAQENAINKEIAKASYEQFQESSDYLKFFGAILSMTAEEAEKAGNVIKDRLLDELSKGTITSHQYIKSIKDVNDQLVKNRTALRGVTGSFLTGGQQGVVEYREQQRNNAAIEYELARKKTQELEKQLENASNLSDEEREALTIKILGAQADEKNAEQNLKNAAKALNMSVKTYTTLSKVALGLALITGAVEGIQNAARALAEMFEALGDNDNANFWSDVTDGIDSITSILNPVNNLLNSAMKGDVSGVVSNAFSAPVQMIAGPITALSKLHDKQLQREIEASKQRQKEMTYLSSNLEKALGRALGGVYNVSNTEQGQAAMDKFSQRSKQYEGIYLKRVNAERELEELKSKRPTRIFSFTGSDSSYQKELKEWEEQVRFLESSIRSNSYIKNDTYEYLKKAEETQKYYDMQRASLSIQRDELEKQIQAERNKKDSDSGAITDMEQQLEELKDEIYNFAKDMAKALYDIDVKSWAQQLGDALYDAWKNGENGAEAFRKKAKEIIGDVAKNIVVTKMIETALRPLETAIVDMMDAESGELDPVNFATKVSDILVGVIDKVSPAFETTLEAVDAALKSRGFGSLKDGSGSSASGSIKSITENTADLLASYVNAMRADVSVQRIDIAAIRVSVEAIANRNVLTQTQESYLENIASYTLRCATASEGILSLIRSATLDKSQGFYIK